ncbi:hypothetical protein [Massilia horti]|uniref:Uncharacterized protein n=1 Tax=Massilia horti TaxID=2562153 RepID=A0A4Y9T493_9BURK|nr:hypothetical protein [Massilia horti]TFW31878.1 hypothetical protein E4O92_12190 [Massilia horti]
MPVYVQHEALGQVNDVFNAEALWQAPGLALFARRPLLRDLLERSPREQRGRAATRCFSHVKLLLPQEEVDDDRHLTRGARARDLAQSLTDLHRKDFGDLLGSDEVRYDVVGDDKLEPGQVEVKFGHAVYLPAPGERPLYTISASRDSAVWKTVCPVYPNQRLTLIGESGLSATYAVPGWPFGADDAILLVNDGPEAPIEVQVRPKDAFECSFDAANGYYTIRSRRAGPDGTVARLFIKIGRVSAPASLSGSSRPNSVRPAPPRAPAVWKGRAVSDPELTALPVARPVPKELDATYAPVARQRVCLAALALPRLSRYRETGAVALEIGLNRALVPASQSKDAVISFAVDHADEVHAITAAGRQRIDVPSSFTPIDAIAVRLLVVAPGMADRYRALLCLPNAPGLPVAADTPCTFGRGVPTLAALRVLDSPGFLRHADGATGTSADRLGLSRNAFSFEASKDGYRIVRLAPMQALYHLDDQLDFVASIDNAAPGQPYLLPVGHHLVAGHYVLRFDA